MRITFSLCLLLSGFLTGCSARIDHRGKLPEPEVLSQLQTGVHEKEDVQRLLGSPSSLSTFDDNVWLYVSKVTEKVSFFDPKTVSQKAVRIAFNDAGKVASIDEIDGEQRVISASSRITPSYERERSFLQSVFGSYGRQARKEADKKK